MKGLTSLLFVAIIFLVSCTSTEAQSSFSDSPNPALKRDGVAIVNEEGLLESLHNQSIEIGSIGNGNIYGYTIHAEYPFVEEFYSILDNIVGGSNWYPQESNSMYVRRIGDNDLPQELNLYDGITLDELDQLTSENGIVFWMPDRETLYVSIRDMGTFQDAYDNNETFQNSMAQLASNPYPGAMALLWNEDKPQPIPEQKGVSKDYLLIVNRESLEILNLNTFQREKIVSIESEWVDRQPTNGFVHVLNFKDESDGELDQLFIDRRYPEARNPNFGGGNTKTLDASDPMILENRTPQSEIRYPIEDWIIRDAAVFMKDGREIRTLYLFTKPGLTGPDPRGYIHGDYINPFTLIKHSGKPAESWISDFRISKIMYSENKIIAENINTGERRNLLEISESWDAAQNNMVIEYRDLSKGLVLGGSIDVVLDSGRTRSGGNVLIASYRFDSAPVKASPDYFLESGSVIKVPVKNYDRQIMNSRPLRDRAGTVVFADGNVLPIAFK